MKIDLEQIRDLLQVVSQTDITELSIESGGEKITVKKSTPTTAASAPVTMEISTAASQMVPSATATVQSNSVQQNNHNGDQSVKDNPAFVSITSPMVGTFYRAASPTTPAFVEVGDHVNVGQTVCIIEAMKLMNDMPSEVAGKIVKVVVEDGTTVEFGQQLFLVDPNG